MVKDRLKLLPESSGCYLMKNSSSDIIYVGKAKNLKNRVTSYFNGAHDYKTTKLVQSIADFDYILTNNENEALLLENNLIKKYRPIYNILLMDDKSYPYIKISADKYPTITVVRELKKDKKAQYFGPYSDRYSAGLIVKIVNEIFPIKKCKKLPKKVCLYYHLDQCLGMCEYNIDNSDYLAMINQIKKLLTNQSTTLKSLLKSKMNEASRLENYEKAAHYRDYLLAIQHISDKQDVEYQNILECDVINYVISHGFVAFQVLMVRNHKLLDKIVKVYPYYGNLQDDFETFYIQYREIALVSEYIVVPLEIDLVNLADARHYIKSRFDSLLSLASKNAQQAIFQKVDGSDGQGKIINEGLYQLSTILKLNLARIEVFDNSHLSGTNNVSAMIVNQDGVFNKKEYRLYKLADYESDITSFFEVLYRRYFRALKDGNIHPCDLLIMDGGIQQINIAKDVRNKLGLQFAIIGLSKNTQHQTSKVIDELGQLIDFSQAKEAFLFLTLLQDEVHRFVLNFHQKKRAQASLFSIIDGCQGIGQHRKDLLMEKFKDIKAISAASVIDLQGLLGEKSGQKLFDYLRAI